MLLSDEIDLNTWVISDTHFGHDNILKYEPKRLEAMQAQGFASQNDWLMALWNRVIGKDDLVLHLGDFAFKQKEVLYKLHGRIVMLVGNHDIKSRPFFRQHQARYPGRFELVEGVECLSEPEGVSGLVKHLGGHTIFFCHYPLVTPDPYIGLDTILRTQRHVKM